jgi:hypothetical protein
MAYEPLAEAADNKAWVSIGGLGGPSFATLTSSGGHLLEFGKLSSASGSVTLEPGSLNLYTYPGGLAGEELQLIRRVMLELAGSATHLFESPDPVGAFAIHALIVCNSEASLELAFAILEIAPKLALQTHAGQPFSGEGNLHILCANRREALAIRMIDLVDGRFSKEEARAFLRTQAVGAFFDSPPMCWYGDSPLSYACVFGLRALVLRMLGTGHVSLNDTGQVGAIVGFYPLHAVAANGLRCMYDFLVGTDGQLAEALRARKFPTTTSGRLVQWNLDGMSPMQLAAKRGLRYMFQHIVKSELTTVLWTWGPVTQYQISLDGIDSSGHGASDVMEVVTREEAAPETKEFILDDFMQGFIFRLYEQKWERFGWCAASRHPRYGRATRARAPPAPLPLP